jgi:hypothetical protein
LVGDHFIKSLLSVIITSNMSVEELDSNVRNKIAMLQHTCPLLDIFPTFLTINFLVDNTKYNFLIKSYFEPYFGNIYPLAYFGGCDTSAGSGGISTMYSGRY